MLYYIKLCNIRESKVPRGESGRIVIEVDPEFKKELYSVLDKAGMSLKDWFVQKATEEIERQSHRQLNFFNKVLESHKITGQTKEQEDPE